MNETILVVEDMKIIRSYIKNILVNEDYNIIEASNGVEALKMCSELVPDLIVMDIMMPEMDGIETVKKLKENPVLSSVPVIMLTVLTETDIVLQSYENGADYYLSKPLDRISLIKAIKFVEKNKHRGV
jgi:CheY-like chemotaxis protein